MDLMFAARLDDPSGRVNAAAARLFQTLGAAMGSPDDHLADDEASLRFKLLFAATMQGTATLIASRRVTRALGMHIVDDASDLLLQSALGRRVLPEL
jgi:hypothetical protein